MGLGTCVQILLHLFCEFVEKNAYLTYNGINHNYNHGWVVHPIFGRLFLKDFECHEPQQYVKLKQLTSALI